MYSEEIYAKQRDWADGALSAMRNLLPEMAPVAAYPNWQPRERETILFLLSATARSSESAFLLCAFGQLWDAEVLIRSTLEGSLKLAYLLQARETFATRHSEYAEHLFEVALLKNHGKAQSVLAAISDPDAAQWRPIRDILLSDRELAALSARHKKAARRALETRWGFTGLVSELSGSNDPLFNGLGALVHGYSIASHIQHADIVGTSIALERDLRSTERRDSLHLAHEARLLSDLLNFFLLRLAVGYRFVGADMSQLSRVKIIADKAKEPFGEAAEDWFQIEYFGLTSQVP
jgi:hypothetical protein